MAPTILSNDLVGVKESFNDALLRLNPYQIPFLSRVRMGPAIQALIHTWFEDELFKMQAKATAAADEAATAIVVDDVEAFRTEQVIRIGEELALVTAVAPDTKTVTVVRGYAGTTAEAILADDVIHAQFVQGQEGADARKSRYKARTPHDNIMQIFDESVSISGSAAAVANRGIDNLYNDELAKKFIELAAQLDNACMNGIRYADGTIRQMRGVKSFIKTNVTAAAGAEITLDLINDMVDSVAKTGAFKNGVEGYEIVVPTAQKKYIDKIDKDSLRDAPTSDVRGTVVNYLRTMHGTFPIVINDSLSADEILFLDMSRIQVIPLEGREFYHEFLGKKGDRFEGMIVGEYSLEFHQEKAHARIKGLKK